MNEKNVIKAIKQLQNQINTLEELNEKDEYINYTKKEVQDIIDRNEGLKNIYMRRLRDLKWNWLLRGNDIKTILN